MDALSPLHNLFALLTVPVGAIARGYTGFGSGLIMAPLLALLWGPIDPIIFILALGLLATAQMTIPAAKIGNWRDIAPICAAAVIVTPLGTAILVSLDGDIVKKSLPEGSSLPRWCLSQAGPTQAHGGFCPVPFLGLLFL